MPHDTDDLIARLDRLLDRERAALMEGRFEELAEIVSDKEMLIEALNAAELAIVDKLAPVNSKVVRNQALLEQALNGIRSVARKLGDIRQIRKSFDTYDQSGKKNQIRGDTQNSVERRA